MIKNRKPISIAEVDEYLKEENPNAKELKGFIKKFSVISKENAMKLKKELNDLNLIKIKEEHIIKIIDFLPETKEELNKIFVDIGLDEDETNKILEKIKQYK